MSYAQLYAYCQNLSVPVSRKSIRDKCCELTGFPRVPIQRSSLRPEDARGLFFRPEDKNNPFYHQNPGLPLILIARNLNYCWERFVTTKELMHLFDKPVQFVGGAKEFAALIDEFTAPLPDRSPGMDSEVDSFWMALGVLCPELLRQDFIRRRAAQELNDLQIAEALKIPEQYVHRLFDPNFKAIISKFL